MGKCLRPCQQVVSADEYRGEVDRVAAFLATDGRSLTDPLESARERLSDEMDFEEAARVHRQIEKIQQVVRLREDLVRDVDRLHGVAVTAAAEPGAAQLWFVLGGAWHSPVRFGFDAVEGKTVSLDHRLREIVASLEPPRVTVQQRQEHLALLARWYYSSWRDGEWVSFPDMAQAPYRRLVRAISRVLSSER
jgi:excinuclease UvrABC nuclease subunit